MPHDYVTRNKRKRFVLKDWHVNIAAGVLLFAMVVGIAFI